VAEILIIDDDRSVGLTFARMLQMAGYEVSRVESAQAGLARLDSTPPDAVILDMRMPGMDGLDFLRHIRSTPRRTALPVGIVTGDYFLTESVLAELASLGAEIRYKPVWMDDLHELARRLVPPAPPAPKDL
jgi:CheY-like chemotaxis protein